MKTRSQMPRLGVVVIDPAAKTLREVEVCLQEFVGWQFQGEFQGIEYLVEQMPAVVMVDLDAGLEGTFEVVAEIRSAAPRFVRPPVLLGVTEKGKDHGEEWLFRCVRAGFQDFLQFPFDQNDVADVLSKIEEERGEGRRRGGKVVTLFGSCGGSGLTTLAVNLGTILAKQRNKKVGLIDLDMELGDVSFILNVSPRMTIADIATDAQALDPKSLHKALVRHVSGIDVLAAPAKIDRSRGWQP